MKIGPFIKSRGNNTSLIMLDVMIALLPLAVAAAVAFGFKVIFLLLVAIGTALVTDFLFSAIFLKNIRAVFDGSSVVTAMLLCFTISPATSWYIVAFGSFSAILFGKIVWGGLGKNRFNPALVGREFIAAFFPVMTSASIWLTKSLVKTPAINFFPGLQSDHVSEYLSGLLYKTNGAMGEYSIFLIAVGGLYLLWRNRITWHIPLSLLGALLLCCWLVPDADQLSYSMAGVLLATIFMATDMPSSPSTPWGKLYYGLMIGVVTFVLMLGDVRYEYMSFSILILNGFSPKINEVFRPRAWGENLNWKERIEQVFLLTLMVMAVVLAIIALHYYHMVHYLIYVYFIYLIFKFNFSFIKNVSNPI